MQQDDVIIFDETNGEEEKTTEFDEGKRKIFTSIVDPEVDSLHRKFKKGRLIVQPSYQRHFVWDVKKASKLIESALLGIPIPDIYLSQESDNTENVIDGQQRLTSFFSFIDGKFPDDSKYPNESDFCLNGLKVFQELNGKKYSDLPEDYQEIIRCYKLRTITFLKESDSNLKYEIFERLNTGSVALNDQELRNCVYRGKYNDLLKKLSQNKDFMYILGLKKPEKRMKDIELVLRFAAFYHSSYLNYKPPMKLFLKSEIEKNINISDADAKKLENAFKNACHVIRSMFDKNAFKRFHKGSGKKVNGYWEPKKFNASLYDVIMWSFAREERNQLFKNLDAIREAFISIMTDDQSFIDSIELSTSSLQAVNTRFDRWLKKFQEIIGIGEREQRCFSYNFKKSLYETDSTCKICGQRISNIDDASVDHIEQYALGGRTTESNARLTHRFCNWARSRKENNE